MKLEFVNHSSVIVDAGAARLLCDLWLDGRAFDDGWALLSESVHRYEDLRSITHVWFSHEHPDHFNPPNLRKIPEDVRRSITVLYQRTKDRRVARFCEDLRFGAVTELDPHGWWSPSAGVELLCHPHPASWGEGDSWLCVRTKEATILNLNDCEIDSEEQARKVRELVGPVDVLLTQFSYASWQGNESATSGRRKHARELLEHIRMRVNVLQPRFVVPFASFVRFCHEENAYLNEDMNDVRDVAAFIEAETTAKPVVLYPGDVWDVGAPHDNTASLARYAEDLRRARQQKPVTSAPVSEEDLVAQARAFCEKLKTGVDPRMARLYLGYRALANGSDSSRPGGLLRRLRVLKALRSGGLEPVHIFLRDRAKAFTFDLDQGLVPSDTLRTDCDIELGSEALSYCFRFPWGGETLQVNGRFREPAIHDDNERWTRANRLLKYFRLARRRSFGYEPSLRTFAAAASRRIQARFGRSIT